MYFYCLMLVLCCQAYKPAAFNDGLLEVVGIKGVMQMVGVVYTGVGNSDCC